jgi:hypothetical protein
MALVDVLKRQKKKPNATPAPGEPRYPPGDASEDGAPQDREDQAQQTFEPTPWPERPSQDAFYGLAGDIVAAIEPNTESDPAALLIQFLVAFGSACKRSAYFQVGPKRHYTNLFCVLVGKTAKGRKGTAWSWVEALFPEQIAPGWPERVKVGLSSGEGLIWQIRDEIRKTEPIKEKKRITGYQEVVVDKGISDKRLLVLEEEFANVLRQAAREGNTLSAVVRQSWDSGVLSSLTKNSPGRATDAHVSIVGHITKQELLTYLTATDQGNGFANRFLWACARRSKMLPDGGEQIDLSGLQLRILNALNHAGMTTRMGRSAGAARLWREVYPRLSRERPGLLGLVTNRAEAQVLRLSIIYALLGEREAIDEVHLRAALALWDYLERSCAWIFGESTGNRDADELWAALRAAGEAGMNLTQINKVFSNNKPAADIRRALGLLVDLGLASPGQPATGGRPAENWKVASQGYESYESYES